MQTRKARNTGSRANFAKQPKRRFGDWLLTPFCIVAILAMLGTGGCGRDLGGANRPSGGNSGDTVAPAPGTNAPGTSVPAPTLAAIRSAFESGRHVKTLQMAKTFLITNPGHPEVLYLAGQCLMAEDRPDQAIETLQLVPEADPEFGIAALGQIADTYFHRGEPAKAEQSFRRLIEVHGDFPLAHSRLALLMNSQGKRFEAMPHLLRLAQMQDITRRELGGLVTVSEQCSVERVPGTTGSDGRLVEGDLRRSRQMGMTGKWEQAFELAERLRVQFPDSTAIAAYMGTLMVNLQRIEQLPDWHKDLPTGIENQPEYWGTMARWMAMVGDHREAIRCACESAKRDPTNALVYETLARSLRAIGDHDQAKLVDARAQLLTETRGTFVHTLTEEATDDRFASISEGMLALHRPFESLAWLREAAKLNPTNVRIKAIQKKLQDYSPPEDLTAWTVCGMDVQQFPLPGASVRSKIAERGNDASPGQHEIDLVDVASGVGIDFQYDSGNDRSDGSYLLHQTMGGGIGVIDFDLNGWPDLYFSQGGGEAFTDENLPNRMFRNLSGRSYVDITGRTGSEDTHHSQGVTTCDWNQDGFDDLIVANIGPNTFYRNNGDGTFTSVRVPEWEGTDYWTSLVLSGDLDGDGILDLLECNYIDDESAMRVRCTPTEQLCAPIKFRASPNRVLRGTGDGSFEPWPELDPLAAEASYSLGVIISDLDGRHGNDVFIANDTRENDLWISSPAGEQPTEDSDRPRYTLGQEARLRGCSSGPLGGPLGCMGIAPGDFDHSGTLDLYVTNYYNEASNLFLQQPSGLFVDSAARYQNREPTFKMVGFGTQAVDIDRDGWLDVAVLNGHAVDRRDKGEPLQMKPQLFRGEPGKFQQASLKDAYWDKPAVGRTLAALDWNRDGRPDLVANHLDQPTALLENRSVVGNWLQLELVATRGDREAVGTKVTLECGDRSWVGWVTAGAGYLASNESVLDFGLGEVASIDRVLVEWASGDSEEFVDLGPNGRFLLVQGTGEAYARQRVAGQ